MKSVFKNILGEDLECFSDKGEQFTPDESNQAFGYQKYVSSGN